MHRSINASVSVAYSHTNVHSEQPLRTVLTKRLCSFTYFSNPTVLLFKSIELFMTCSSGLCFNFNLSRSVMSSGTLHTVHSFLNIYNKYLCVCACVCVCVFCYRLLLGQISGLADFWVSVLRLQSSLQATPVRILHRAVLSYVIPSSLPPVSVSLC